jgi:hypothetical protein
MFSKKIRNVVIITLCLLIPLVVSIVEGFNGTMNILLGDDRTKEIMDEYNELKNNTTLLQNEGLSQDAIDNSNSNKKIDELKTKMLDEISRNGKVYASIQGRIEKTAESGGLSEENSENMFMRQYGSK